MNPQVALAESGTHANGGVGFCNSSAGHFPALKNFYAFGDSYSAGIGANCGWVKDEFDLKGACLKWFVFGFRCIGGWSSFYLLFLLAASRAFWY
jgi:hypothetical protein